MDKYFKLIILFVLINQNTSKINNINNHNMKEIQHLNLKRSERAEWQSYCKVGKALDTNRINI